MIKRLKKKSKSTDLIRVDWDGTNLDEIKRLFPDAKVDREKGLCIGELEGITPNSHKCIVKDVDGRCWLKNKNRIDDQYEVIP